jgi:hypothetical protein
MKTPEIGRLTSRKEELRRQLAELPDPGDGRLHVARDRARLAAKLRHVERRVFELQQARLFR